ncbi:MAG TPA: MFS transporter [Syntrophorhabdaceae bacterium]|nr:MFS transporter [Syntrophorhabdaceae bacterium]
MQNQGSIAEHKTRNLFTRDFVLGFLALFAFLVANYALLPTLPIFLTRLGSNVSEIGVLIGIYGASSLGARLLVGSALLKYSEKKVMMFGALLFTLTFLASIVLRPFWPFFAIRFIQGASFAFLDTAALACVVKLTPSAYRGQGIGYFLLAPSFAMVIGPTLGMLLINQYSFTIFFLACTGLSFCAFFFSWKLKAPETITPDKNTPANINLFLDMKIITPGLTGFLQMFALGATMAFFPLYAIQCGVTNPGLFFSAIAIMMVAGRVLGGRIAEAYSKERIILVFLFLLMIATIILSFSKTLPMFIFVGMLLGIGTTLFLPASMAYALDYAGSSGGTALGTIRALMDLGAALGPMVMGIIIPFTGYRIMFLCLALICLVNPCYFQFYVRKRKCGANSLKTLRSLRSFHR